MKKNNRLLNAILPIISVCCVLCVWAIASKKVNSEYILPNLKQTTDKFFELLAQKDFYLAFLLSFLRSFLAFTISFLIAFVLAIVSVKNTSIKSLILPVISIMRALPTIAVVLILLFWTNSQIAPIIVTTLVVLPTSFTHIESAFLSLEKGISEAGEVDGANHLQVFIFVELPQALPLILNAIGGGISLNFKLMVAAEVIAQTAISIGYMLNVAKVYFEMAEMFAIVCFTVILGVIIETVFNYLSKKAGDWQ